MTERISDLLTRVIFSRQTETDDVRKFLRDNEGFVERQVGIFFEELRDRDVDYCLGLLIDYVNPISYGRVIAVVGFLSVLIPRLGLSDERVERLGIKIRENYFIMRRNSRFRVIWKVSCLVVTALVLIM